MIDDVLNDADQHMGKAVEALKRDLSTIRTGRASPALVERLMIEYYGTPTPLIQLASVAVPEARQLLIQPYDKSSISSIERAISKSDLGLTPNNDGRAIRLNLPALTEERRRDLVKVSRRKTEDARVAVRNIRRQANDDIREAEREKLVSEDERKRGEERLQKLTDSYIVELDQVGERKEAEIMEV
jgi:ribosome recycling factor